MEVSIVNTTEGFTVLRIRDADAKYEASRQTIRQDRLDEILMKKVREAAQAMQARRAARAQTALRAPSRRLFMRFPLTHF